jgi:hypothetical protein
LDGDLVTELAKVEEEVIVATSYVKAHGSDSGWCLCVFGGQSTQDVYFVLMLLENIV